MKFFAAERSWGECVRKEDRTIVVVFAMFEVERIGKPEIDQ
jgi:hypothetical protein